MDYGTSVREKEENFDNVLRIFTAYLGISRVRLTRETVAFTMRVKPGFVEKQQRQRRRQQQSYVNTSEDKKSNFRKEKRFPEDKY